MIVYSCPASAGIRAAAAGIPSFDVAIVLFAGAAVPVFAAKSNEPTPPVVILRMSSPAANVRLLM